MDELIFRRRGDDTVLIVTHTMQQASCVSEDTAFMDLDQVVEYGPTAKLFTNHQLSEAEACTTS